MKIRETEFSESAERPLRSVAQKCVATDIYRYDRGDILPSLCKGRQHAERDGRVVVKSTNLFTGKSLYENQKLENTPTMLSIQHASSFAKLFSERKA